MNRQTRYRRRFARRPSVECLEQRVVFDGGLPFGAAPADTGELMLGDVLVSVVLMESSEATSSVNENSEDWTETSIAAVKEKVAAGLLWWQEALGQITDKHWLDFQIDYTYADNPVPTRYEPIARPSFDFQFWIDDFLNHVGFNQSGNFSTDIRAFNHAQRVEHDADWAFTLFVVNDENDEDGLFAPGGFSRAFAFSGGRFFITPAGRPSSTIAHETGHMFWARDEYSGGGSYNALRGYYNTQNLNAADNPTPGFQQVPSIMDTGNCESGGGLLCTAYQTHTSSPTSLEMIGWRDSDGDGVFDVADVPHALQGVGRYDEDTGLYRFVGSSSVQTLPNRNYSGLQNDITVNLISRAEYRVDAGAWSTAAEYDEPTATLDLSIPVPPDAESVQIRTIDATTGVSSPLFLGRLDRPSATTLPGLQGFVWDDQDQDGEWDPSEPGLPGWTVELVDATGSRLVLGENLEPDEFSSGATLNDALPNAELSAVGSQVSNPSVTSVSSSNAATGERVFASINGSCGGFCSEWTASRQLRIDFVEPVTTVSLDAAGTRLGSFGRLEVYDAAGNLLARHTTNALAEGSVEKMTASRPTPEIAYALAHAHRDSTVVFDNLETGPAAATLTGESGGYVLPYLEPGDYTVRAVAVGSASPTDPESATRMVTLAAGAAIDGVDFAFQPAQSPWRNENHLDVNNDGFVSPVDVLQVINDLNNNGPRELSDETTPPYLDVNGDGSVTSQDVLLVINYLNSMIGESESNRAPATPPGNQDVVAEGEFHFPPAAARAFSASRLPAESRRPADSQTSPPQPVLPASADNDWRVISETTKMGLDGSPARDANIAPDSGPLADELLELLAREPRPASDPLARWVT